jgi:hypothetical protein
MNPSIRFRIAGPLIVLTGVSLFAAVGGTVPWWSETPAGELVLVVINWIVLGTAFGLSLSVFVDRRAHDIPWRRIGVIAACFLLSCGAVLLPRLLER